MTNDEIPMTKIVFGRHWSFSHWSLGFVGDWGSVSWIFLMHFRLFLALFDPDTVQRWFEAGGYFVLFGLLFACGVGLPLPEDIPLLLGGYFHETQGWNIYVIGVLVVWAVILGGMWLWNSARLHDFALIGGGFLLGMLAMYIAMHLYRWK